MSDPQLPLPFSDDDLDELADLLEDYGDDDPVYGDA
jgi:hypothetical protein